MGSLKLLLNIALLWALYQPGPDGRMDLPPSFGYADQELSDHQESGEFLPAPQVLLVKAEEPTSGADHPLPKNQVAAVLDFGHADTEKYSPGISAFFHIEYCQLILFPFHSYL